MAAAAASARLRTVLVTGASSGMGACIARRLLDAGERVAVVARRTEKLTELYGGDERAVIITADLGNMEQVERMAGEASEAFDGQLDFFFANAGFGTADTLESATPATWQKLFAVNCQGVFHALKHLTPALKAAKGCVVATSTIGATVCVPGSLPYSAVKAGMEHGMKIAALHLAPAGVRVNVVAPGAINTDFTVAAGLTREQADARYQAVAKNVPLGFVPGASAVADAVEFLSDAKRAAYITGVVLPVDGGLPTTSWLAPNPNSAAAAGK